MISQDGSSSSFFFPSSTTLSNSCSSPDHHPPTSLLFNNHHLHHNNNNSSSNTNGFAQQHNTTNSISYFPAAAAGIHPNPNPNLQHNPHHTIINPSSSSSSSPAITNQNSNKRKRNQPGKPDPESEVVALSPHSLMATNRFICEVCNKGFQRDQNLQLHRRGHNLPWKLKQKNPDVIVKKKVYICPEKTCVHHDPSRALGDLTGIKKHFSRKHGEKKWKCDKCGKKYAVMSDWKAHGKICGTKEYKCDCGTVFSRKDSFITHRAFCDALTEERMRINTNTNTITSSNINHQSSSSATRIPPFYSPTLSTPPPSSSSASTHLIGRQQNNNSIIMSQHQHLPQWLDHHPVHNTNVHLMSPSNSAQMMLPPDFAASQTNHHLNLFGSVPQSMLPPKEEQQDFISLYNSGSSSNMSATALLQKAAQIGSTRSNTSSSLFATAFSSMNPTSSAVCSSNSLLVSNLASFNNSSNNNNGDGDNNGLVEENLYANSSLLMTPGSGSGAEYSITYDNSSKAVLMRRQQQLGGGGGGQQSSSGSSSGVGMRDFLGTLGGGPGDGRGGNNNNSLSWPT